MQNEPSYTGIAPQTYSTGGTQGYNPETTLVPFSRRELVDIWFIDPLKKMDGHQAFVCLSICFHLYEKYLRKTNKIAEDENFSKGHAVFNQIGNDLIISSDDAYEFWTCWRNGLSHCGMPIISEKYSWGMTANQINLVVIEGNTFTINPWKIRDKILNKVESKKQIWEDELAPLMQVFKIGNV